MKSCRCIIGQKGERATATGCQPAFIFRDRRRKRKGEKWVFWQNSSCLSSNRLDRLVHRAPQKCTGLSICALQCMSVSAENPLLILTVLPLQSFTLYWEFRGPIRFSNRPCAETFLCQVWSSFVSVWQSEQPLWVVFFTVFSFLKYLYSLAANCFNAPAHILSIQS